jgi:predicted DCC family thiol-disulfide oxidoreductase YuxK
MLLKPVRVSASARALAPVRVVALTRALAPVRVVALTRALAPVRVFALARSLSTASTTTAAAAPPPAAPLAIALYDGSCPLCAREIAFLRTFARAPSCVSFVDVSDAGFDDAAFWAAQRLPPVAREKLLDEMHVVDVRARVVNVRVPAFHTLYSALGYSALAFTARPPWDGIADRVYEFVRLNKHRVAWLAR